MSKMLKKVLCVRKYHAEVLRNELKSLDEMPGPRGFLNAGNIWNYSKLFGKYSFDEMHVSGMDKYKKYGPIINEKMIPGVSIVWLYDPNDFALIFNDSTANLPCRKSHLALEKFRRDRPEIYSSGGLLPTNGHEWWQLRSELQKGLSSPKNVRNFLPDADKITREFIDLIPHQCDCDNIVQDFILELERLSLELTCFIAFDERLQSFSLSERNPNSRSSKLIKAGDDTNNSILPTDQGIPFWKFFETNAYKTLRESQEFMQKIASEFVGKRSSENRDGNSLLDQYLKNPNLNVKDIVGMSSDLLLAGVHTTSFTTAFVLYYISRDARVQNLMYNEALKVLPSVDDEITPQILNSEIPYIRAVLKESFRLNPISIGVGRVLNHDTIFSGTYLVPKNTTVVTQNFVACRLEENFSNPLVFMPERWIKKNGEKLNVNPYLVIPFGHGMRSCIARRLAEQAILVFLLRLIRSYKLEWKGVETLDIKTKLINRPSSDITIKFEKR